MGVAAVIWSPVRVLKRVAEERALLMGLLVVAAAAVVNVLISAIFILGGFAQAEIDAALEAQQQAGLPLPPGQSELLDAFFQAAGVFDVVFSALWPFVVWLVVGLVMHLVTRFFGGEGSLSATLAAVGVAHVVLILSSLVSFPLSLLEVSLIPDDLAQQESLTTPYGIVGLVATVLFIAFWLWYAALVVIGAAQARNVSYGRSAGSCAISCAGVVGLALVALVALIFLIAIGLGGFTPQ